MRNQLLPLLKDMYGTGFTHNLSALAHHSVELSEFLTKTMFQPFYDKVVVTPVAVWVDCEAFVEMPMFFWKYACKVYTYLRRKSHYSYIV